MSPSEEEDVSSSEPDENGKEPDPSSFDEPESEPPSDALVAAPDDASGALDPSLALAGRTRGSTQSGIRAGRARKVRRLFARSGTVRQGDISSGGRRSKAPWTAATPAPPPRNRSRGRRRAGRTPGIATRRTSPRTTFETNAPAPRREPDRVRGRVNGAPSHGGGEIRHSATRRREPHQTRFRRARVARATPRPSSW